MHGAEGAVAGHAADASHDLVHSVHENWAWLVQLITRPLHLHSLEWIVVSWLVLLGLGYLAYRVSTRLTLHPSGLQNISEVVYEWLESLVLSMAGPVGRPYIPLIGTIFIYVLSLNLVGLIPGLVSPTASLNCTAALAGLTIVLVHLIAIKETGPKAYFLHFCGEPLWLAPLMLPIHVVGEFLAKPLSLAVRLFGNIFGEDQVIVNLTVLGITIWQTCYLPIPVQFPLLVFGIFTSFVQALVFAMLATTYIALLVGGHHEGADSHDHSPAASNHRGTAAGPGTSDRAHGSSVDPGAQPGTTR